MTDASRFEGDVEPIYVNVWGSMRPSTLQLPFRPISVPEHIFHHEPLQDTSKMRQLRDI